MTVSAIRIRQRSQAASLSATPSVDMLVRIHAILRITAAHDHRDLVLSALSFGCGHGPGSFGNPPAAQVRSGRPLSESRARRAHQAVRVQGRVPPHHVRHLRPSQREQTAQPGRKPPTVRQRVRSVHAATACATEQQQSRSGRFVGVRCCSTSPCNCRR